MTLRKTRNFIGSLILNSHPNFSVNHFSYTCALKKNIGKLNYLLKNKSIFQNVLTPPTPLPKKKPKVLWTKTTHYSSLYC